MLRFIIALSAVCLVLPSWAAPPSDASIEKLLGLMKTQSTLDGKARLGSRSRKRSPASL